MNKERCYHNRNSWLIAGGHYQWCYVCGALQKMKQGKGNSVYPISKWQRPTADKNNNPYEKWEKSIKS